MSKKQKVTSVAEYFEKKPKASTIENLPIAGENVVIPPKPITGSVDFVSQFPLFASCPTGVRYDIALLRNAPRPIPDGVIYEVLTKRNYLPDGFKFPPNHDTPARQCSVKIFRPIYSNND